MDILKKRKLLDNTYEDLVKMIWSIPLDIHNIKSKKINDMMWELFVLRRHYNQNGPEPKQYLKQRLYDQMFDFFERYQDIIPKFYIDIDSIVDAKDRIDYDGGAIIAESENETLKFSSMEKLMEYFHCTPRGVANSLKFHKPLKGFNLRLA